MENLATTLVDLKKPFDKKLVKERFFGRDKEGQAIYVNYVSWDAVADRLDEVYPDWSFKVRWEIIHVEDFVLFIAHGTIKVGEVERDGIGAVVLEKRYLSSNFLETSIKSAEHDALKRAAVKFGVARYLYSNEEFQLRNGRRDTRSEPMPSRNKPLSEDTREDAISEIIKLAKNNKIALHSIDNGVLKQIPFINFNELYLSASNGNWRKFFKLYHSFKDQYGSEDTADEDEIPF